ncbi:MAG: substrate-binding periplasmic protein [Sphingomonadaceae bacterium]
MSFALSTRRQWLRQVGGLMLSAGSGTPLWAQLPPRLRVTMVNLMPWSGTANTGVLVELARDIAQRSGLIFDIMPLPYARALVMIEEGSIDLMLAVQSARVEHSATCVASVSDAEITLLARPNLVVSTLADLHGKRVGHLRHADYDPDFAAATDILKYEFNSYAQGLRMLQIGRLDALVAIRGAIQYTLRSMGLPPANDSSMLTLRRAPVLLYQSRWCITSAATERALAQACASLRRENRGHALLQHLLD